MHQRQAIREQVVETLTAGVAAVGGRVFPMRFIEYAKAELPAIGVYTVKETIDVQEGGLKRDEVPRTLALKIDAVARVSESVENDLDDMAEQIEIAMDADRSLGGEAAESFLSDTEIGINVDGDAPVGVVTLTYTISYQARASA